MPTNPEDTIGIRLGEHAHLICSSLYAIDRLNWHEFLTNELRVAWRKGRESARPQPWTKNECDLCQEQLVQDGWRWVEEGWSLACNRCWNIIAKAERERCAQAAAAERERVREHCAQIAEESKIKDSDALEISIYNEGCDGIARAIRACDHLGDPK